MLNPTKSKRNRLKRKFMRQLGEGKLGLMSFAMYYFKFRWAYKAWR